MAIGERIHFFRTLRNMTQKYLGQAVGFPQSSADVRIAQYEMGTRVPKSDLTAKFAEALGVSTEALEVPNIDSYSGLMHTLFALEDIYGIKIDDIDGELCIRLDKNKGITYLNMFDMLNAWHEQSFKLENDEITKEEYDEWRYNYPRG